MATASRFCRRHPHALCLRWLLLVCLLGLQLHVPSHALATVVAALSDPTASSEQTTGEVAADAPASHGSAGSDCCPAGILALGHSQTASAFIPTKAVLATPAPHLLTVATPPRPYFGQAPPY